MPIFASEFNCPFCDEVVDRFGDHCLVCSCGGDRTKRHNCIRNEVFFFCNGARLNPELERPGLLQPRPLIGASAEDGSARDADANRRPADVYLPRWRQGLPVALDFAVTSGLRGDVVSASAQDRSSAVTQYEDFKCEYLNTAERCAEEGIKFIPVVAEAHGGGWGNEAHKVWNALAKQKCSIIGERESDVASMLLQSLGLIIQRENASAILRSWPTANADRSIAAAGISASC